MRPRPALDLNVQVRLEWFFETAGCYSSNNGNPSLAKNSLTNSEQNGP